jgi:hypothetical protein
VVAVVLAYGLATILIALNSIPLASVNAVILVLILFFLFEWRELFGKFAKRRSALNEIEYIFLC